MDENNTKLNDIVIQFKDVKETIEGLKQSLEFTTKKSKEAKDMATQACAKVQTLTADLNTPKLQDVKMESQSQRDNLLLDGIHEVSAKD